MASEPLFVRNRTDPDQWVDRDAAPHCTVEEAANMYENDPLFLYEAIDMLAATDPYEWPYDAHIKRALVAWYRETDKYATAVNDILEGVAVTPDPETEEWAELADAYQRGVADGLEWAGEGADVTPTQLTLRKLRADGWPLVEVVEHWDHYQQRRHDLFGMWDVLAVDDDTTLAVQTTSYTNVSARLRKIADHPNLPACRKAGWELRVHGWRKVKGRWTLARDIDIS